LRSLRCVPRPVHCRRAMGLLRGGVPAHRFLVGNGFCLKSRRSFSQARSGREGHSDLSLANLAYDRGRVHRCQGRYAAIVDEVDGLHREDWRPLIAIRVCRRSKNSYSLVYMLQQLRSSPLKQVYSSRATRIELQPAVWNFTDTSHKVHRLHVSA
jgi:hypothetical protein